MEISINIQNKMTIVRLTCTTVRFRKLWNMKDDISVFDVATKQKISIKLLKYFSS